jgi:hypothetical protein
MRAIGKTKTKKAPGLVVIAATVVVLARRDEKAGGISHEIHVFAFYRSEVPLVRECLLFWIRL